MSDKKKLQEELAKLGITNKEQLKEAISYIIWGYNMEIRIYRPDLYRKGQIENHTSLIWTRKFFEPGNFELHAPLTAENLDLLQEGNIVSKKDSKEAGVIEHIEKHEGSEENKLIIQGRFLGSYMDRRLIKSTINYNGLAENAMRYLLQKVEPIPLVQLGELNGYEDKVEFQVTMKNLLTYQTKLAKTSNIGYRFTPDFRNHVILFDTYKGIDRSANQHDRARVIFSDKYENLNNAIYTYNDQNLKTCAIIGGEGEGAERIYYTLGGGEGLGLREIFVDAKDIQSEGLTAEEYKAALLQRGQEALNEHIITESLECDTLPDINYKYRIDYDLGDIVTVKKKSWGLYMNQRITELQEIYENDEMYIIPTFGDPLPEKIDWSE